MVWSKGMAVVGGGRTSDVGRRTLKERRPGLGCIFKRQTSDVRRQTS
jgi:hypothetical protein